MVMASIPAPIRPRGVLVLAALTLATATFSVEAQTPGTEVNPKEECATAKKKSEPATPVERGEASGSKNIGATGWSGGGLGGSHNETANPGSSPSSRTAQPETATGLDPARTASKQTADARCESN